VKVPPGNAQGVTFYNEKRPLFYLFAAPSFWLEEVHPGFKCVAYNLAQQMTKTLT
jgi:hypothetical protein